jgi:hypothetical protein
MLVPCEREEGGEGAVRGIIRILAIYANVVLASLVIGGLLMEFQLSAGWDNLNRFSAIGLAVVLPPLLALATLRWPPA